MSRVLRLEELRPGQLKRALQRRPALVLPVGTIEWHSHHLPLGLDGIKALAIAERVAGKTRSVLAPVSYWAAGGVPYPYTLHLDRGQCRELYSALLLEFATMGFGTILLVNGHFGLSQSLAAREAAIACMNSSKSTVLVFAEYEVLLDVGDRGDHAGRWETSLLWASRPGLVGVRSLASARPLPGVIGDGPRSAGTGRALGRKGLDLAATRMAAAVLRAAGESRTERRAYLRSIGAAVDALERVERIRMDGPGSKAPPVLTPTWIQHLTAAWAGDYHAAAIYARKKARDPWA